jgi:hypothetical protein
MARFMLRSLHPGCSFGTPDPYNAGVDPTNPQSWNMYSYVINNPLDLTDPTGMDYQVCIGGEYGDPYQPQTCEIVGGNTLGDLNADLLPYELEAVGDDLSGSISSEWEGWVEAYVWSADSNYTVTVCGDCGQPPSTDCHDTLAGCGAPIDPGQPGTPTGSGGGSPFKTFAPATPQSPTPQTPKQKKPFQTCYQAAVKANTSSAIHSVPTIAKISVGFAATTCISLAIFEPETAPLTASPECIAGTLANMGEHELFLEGTWATVGKISLWVTAGATAVSGGVRGYCAAKAAF